MLLEMLQITKSFPSGKVLHGIDFRLQRGQIHALVGHNGAGKSTLMKVLGGNFADYGGQILIDGRKLDLHAPRLALEQGVAIIYQDFALVPEMTVAANIALGREPRGLFHGLLPHRRLRQRSAEEAAALGIDIPQGMPVGRLGVAKQQMTEIVRACSQNVRILVMDEPTARLSPGERDHLFDVVRRMADKQGVGIVYISHFLEEVRQIADWVTVLRDGRVVETGSGSDYSVQDLAHLLVGSAPVAGKEAVTPAAPVTRADGAPPALELEHLIVAGRPPLSLSIAAGEVVGLAGLVGAGRTRLARALIGDVASSGALRLAGTLLPRRTPQRSARAGIVMVPEDRKTLGLAMSASIESNISLTALAPLLSRFGIIRRDRRRALAVRHIESFRIRPADRRRLVGTLSGGNAQKVLLARAVASGPKVLILDQPTAGVDVGAKAELHRLIGATAANGTAVLIISDDLDEMLELCDRVLVMSAGRITAQMTREQASRASLLAAMSSRDRTAA